jgi:hypothetical protein
VTSTNSNRMLVRLREDSGDTDLNVPGRPGDVIETYETLPFVPEAILFYGLEESSPPPGVVRLVWTFTGNTEEGHAVYQRSEHQA